MFEVKDGELIVHKQNIKGVQKETDKLAVSTTRMGKVAENAAKKLRTLVGGAILAGVTAIAAAFRQGAKNAAEFEQGMARVATLVDTAQVDIDGLGDSLVRISKESPVALTDLTNGLYQLISAGVDASKAVDVLDVAVKTATGGLTDVRTSVDGLTTVLNAFRLNATDATDVADAFFVAQRNGKTTIEELSGSISKAAPIAAALSVTYEELLAATSALTSGGVETSEAFTQVRAILTAVARNTPTAAKAAQELGVEFSQAAIESKGLAGFINDISKAAGGSAETIAKLFENVEGVTGVLALGGAQAEQFAKNLDDMADRAGATGDAFDKVMETATSTWTVLKNNLNAAFQSLGEKILPKLVSAMESVNSVFRVFNSQAEDTLARLKSIEGVDPEIIATYEIKVKRERFLKDIKEAREEAFRIVNDPGATFDGDRLLALKALGQEIQGIDIDKNIVKPIEEAAGNYDVLTKSIQRATERNKELAEQAAQADGATGTVLRIQSQLQEARLNRAIEYAAQLEIIRRREEQIQGLGATAPDMPVGDGLADDIGGANDLFKELRQSVLEADAAIQKIQFEQALAKADKGVAPLLKSLDDVRGKIETVRAQLDAKKLLGDEFGKESKLLDSLIGDEADIQAKIQEVLKDINDEFQRRIAHSLDPIPVTFLVNRQQALREFKQFLEERNLELPTKLEVPDSLKPFLKDGEDLEEITSSVLDNFTDMGRAILDAADSFGDLSEEVKGFANGILNAVDNFANLRQKVKDGIGGAALLSPTIGIAAGALTAVNHLIKSREENSERMRELSAQLREAERGIARTVNDLLTAGQIGAGTTGTAVQDSLAAIAELVNSRMGVLPEFRTPDNPNDIGVNDAFIKALQNFESLFDELEDLGAIDIDSFRDNFESLVNSDGLNQAVIQTFYGPNGLITALEGLSADLGGFGDSVDGAINKLDFFSSFLGTEGNAGAALFIEELRKLEGLPSELSDFLDELESGIEGGIDISSADGQDFLNGLIEMLASQAQGADFFEGITPDELEEIFNAFRGLASGSVEALSSGIGDALESFRLFSRFMETDLQEQFDRLFDEVLNSGANFSDALVDVLREAQGLDLSSQKGRDRLQEIIAGLTQGLIDGADFGIPDDQLEQLLGLLQGLGAEAGSSEETTARQIISRIITEVTANELVVLGNERNFILQSILDTERSILDAVSGNSFGLFDTAAASNVFNNSFDIQIAQAQNVDQVVEALETEVRRRMTGGFGI